MGGLEAALEATEERVDAALKATAAVNRELKKAKTGAQKGQLRDLRRALSTAAALAGDAATAAEDAGESFDFDEQEHLESGSYSQELLDTAAAQDVAMFAADGRLLCYPSLIKVLPGDAAVEIDRRRERRLRPSRKDGRPGFGPSHSWRALSPDTTWCDLRSSIAKVRWCDWSTCGGC